MRLAYQELSLDQKKTEDKIRTVDPKKANQVSNLQILVIYLKQDQGYSDRKARNDIKIR